MGGCMISSCKCKKTRLYSGQSIRQKIRSYRDYGDPENRQYHDNIRILAGHIIYMIECIDEEDWESAYEALFSYSVAKLLHVKIKSSFKICNTIDEAILFSRTSRGPKLGINLPIVAIMSKGTSLDKTLYPDKIPELARRLFPILLEEWIHLFQYFISMPVNDDAFDFMNSRSFDDSWNVNEVDVYAIYRGLGWDDEILEEIEDRYSERVAFAKRCNSGILL